MQCKLIVQYVNGSLARLDCRDVAEAYESANRLSFSSGKIQLVSIGFSASERAIWNKDWNDESKTAGLVMPR